MKVEVMEIMNSATLKKKQLILFLLQISVKKDTNVSDYIFPLLLLRCE